MASTNNGDHYCLNCLHALKNHENVCKDCHVEMPTKDNNILKYDPGEKYVKIPFIIYADLESLLEKIRTCHNNPNESSAIKINKHTPSGCSIFTHCSFSSTKNSLSHYIGQDCMKKFCKDSKEHALKVIYCDIKEITPLTDEENESYEDQKFCYICKKKI